MCSVSSEQQCIMLNFMNTLQLGDPWLAHSTEEKQRAGNSSAGAGCKSQAYCFIMKEGEREKEQHDQWTTQNGGLKLALVFLEKSFANMCRVLTSPHPMIYFSLLKPKRHEITAVTTSNKSFLCKALFTKEVKKTREKNETTSEKWITSYIRHEGVNSIHEEPGRAGGEPGEPGESRGGAGWPGLILPCKVGQLLLQTLQSARWKSTGFINHWVTLRPTYAALNLSHLTGPQTVFVS